jgi:hypothetical protein
MAMRSSRHPFGRKFPSRLDCVKETIKGQINEMKTSHPNRKVGIVAFDDVVDIIGDGSAEI